MSMMGPGNSRKATSTAEGDHYLRPAAWLADHTCVGGCRKDKELTGDLDRLSMFTGIMFRKCLVEAGLGARVPFVIEKVVQGEL